MRTVVDSRLAGAALVAVAVIAAWTGWKARGPGTTEVTVAESKERIAWYRDEVWRMDAWGRTEEKRDLVIHRRWTPPPPTAGCPQLPTYEEWITDKGTTSSSTGSKASGEAKAGGTEERSSTVTTTRLALPRWSAGGGASYSRLRLAPTGAYGEAGVRVFGPVWVKLRGERSDRNTVMIGGEVHF